MSWEQVQVSDLSEGDELLIGGLAIRVTSGFAHNGWLCPTVYLPAEATVERKVEPKTKTFLVTLTESPEEPGVHHVSQRFVGSPIAGMTTTAPWTLTKVEEQT